MYVEFEFHNHLGLLGIKNSIRSWQARYKIAVTEKTVKYRHRLGMDDEKNFTLFFLTWQGPPYNVVLNRNH